MFVLYFHFLGQDPNQLLIINMKNPNMKISTSDFMNSCDSAHSSKCSLSSTQCEGNYRLIGADPSLNRQQQASHFCEIAKNG